MSLEILSAVWDLELERNDKDVLEVLAWHANADGICWPSKARIMYRTGMSEATVKRSLRSLKEQGLVSVEAHAEGGRGRTPLYKVRPEKGVKKAPFDEWLKGVRPDAKGGQNELKGVRAVTPEPSVKNLQEEPSSPKGSDEPTKDRITLLVDRCREMDFEPTPKQKLTWGNELKAKARQDLGGRELMRLVNLIAQAGSDGYFWSFSRAERELGKPGAKSAIGITPAEDPNVSEEEKSSPYDLGAYLDRKRRTA